MQDIADDLYGQFVVVVADGRNLWVTEVGGLAIKQ